MARLRKPEELHRLAGNPGHRTKAEKTARSAVKPRAMLKMPDGMTTMAQIIFKHAVWAMPEGVYTATDGSALASYCEAEARRREIVEAFQADPVLTVPGSSGQPVANPLLAMERSYAELVSKLGGKLGLDPLARQTLSLQENTEVVDDLLN